MTKPYDLAPVKRFIRTNGLTQKQVAYRMQIHPNYLCALLNNRHTPTEGMLWRLTHALSISYDYLMAMIKRKE